MRVLLAAIVISTAGGITTLNLQNSNAENINNKQNFVLEGFWAAQDKSCESYAVLLQFTKTKIFRQIANGKRSVWGHGYRHEITDDGLEIKVDTRIGDHKLVFDILPENNIKLRKLITSDKKAPPKSKAVKFFTLKKCN